MANTFYKFQALYLGLHYYKPDILGLQVQYERNTSAGNCFEVLLMVKILWKYCA